MSYVRTIMMVQTPWNNSESAVRHERICAHPHIPEKDVHFYHEYTHVFPIWMLIYTYLSTYSHIHIIMEISTLELSFDTNLHLSVISHSQHCIKYFVFLLSQQETQHNCAAQLCKKGKQSINSQWLGNWN